MVVEFKHCSSIWLSPKHQAVSRNKPCTPHSSAFACNSFNDDGFRHPVYHELPRPAAHGGSSCYHFWGVLERNISLRCSHLSSQLRHCCLSPCLSSCLTEDLLWKLKFTQEGQRVSKVINGFGMELQPQARSSSCYCIMEQPSTGGRECHIAKEISLRRRFGRRIQTSIQFCFEAHLRFDKGKERPTTPPPPPHHQANLASQEATSSAAGCPSNACV